MNNVIVVGGSKGGVGKSIVSMSLVDWYMMRGKDVFLVETDTSNPDVGSIYQKSLPGMVAALNLDNENGWLDLIETIRDGANGMDVVVNTGARNQDAISENGWRLNALVEGRHIEKHGLITLWPINTEPDGIQLLKQYMDDVAESKIYVLRNCFFAKPEIFTVYNSSKLMETVAEKGGTYDFPRLAKRCTDTMRQQRITIAEGLEKLTSAYTMEIERWQRECAKIFDAIFGDVSNG